MEARSKVLAGGSTSRRLQSVGGAPPRIGRLRVSRRVALGGVVAIAAAIALAGVAFTSGGRATGSRGPAAAAPPIATSSSGAGPETIVFIVGSQEQATQVRSTLFNLGSGMGLEPGAQVDAQFVIAGGDRAAAILDSYNEVNEIREAQGVALIPIVDLTH